jgi:hypothetical protein
MDSNLVDDVSMTLIHEAEDECVAHDPGMVSAAAMVLVGDVYALLVCRHGSLPYRPAIADTRKRENGLSPFIR